MLISSNTAAWVKKNRVYIAVAIVFIIVAIVFYRKGKKTTTIADLPKDNPNTGTTGNGGVQLSGNQISENDVAGYREKLHSDIYDIFALRNNQLYAELVLLSDTDLVRIYNAYNSKYQAKEGETLLQALKNEYLLGVNGNNVIKRLEKYNLN